MERDLATNHKKVSEGGSTQENSTLLELIFRPNQPQMTKRERTPWAPEFRNEILEPLSNDPQSALSNVSTSFI